MTARFNDDELAAVAAAAVRAGLTAGGFCAEATLAASHGRITSGVDERLETLRQLMAELFAARIAVNRFGGNVNQAVAALHATGAAPPWLPDAVALCGRAVRRLDEIAAAVSRSLP